MHRFPTSHTSATSTTRRVAALLATLLLAGSAVAGTLTVNSTGDDVTPGDGLVTLREAILAAESDGTTDLGQAGDGPDSLDLTGLVGKIILDSTLPAISTDMEIVGPGAATLAIDAESRCRHFILAGATLALDDLTMLRGAAIGAAGGDGAFATSRGGGGGGGAAGLGGSVYVDSGFLRCRGTRFVANRAVGGAGGTGGVGFGEGQGGGGGGGFGGDGQDGSANAGGDGGPGGFLGGVGGDGGETSNPGQDGAPGLDGAGGGGGGAVFPFRGGAGGRGGDGSFGSGGAGGGVGPNAVDGGSGGHGGFGGGAGGRAQGDSASAGIAGAFGGEAGHGGGGGAGLGGAVFVSDSAAAVFTACEFLDNAASGGAGGAGEGGGDSGSAGLGKGGAIFLLETASVGASGSRFLRNSASDALSSATDNPHAYGSGVEIFPLVESIDPVGFARSNQTSVQFLVRFNKPVAEVDVDDFALDTPLASASLDAVNPANSRRIIPVAFDTEYIAEISHGGGISSIRLDALPSATIFDADGAPLSEGYDAGQTLEIDTVPPVVAEIGSQSFNPTNAGAFTFFGVYSEPVSGLTFEAVTATTTGTLMGAGHGGSTFIPGALGSGVCFGGGSRFETASAVDIPGDGSFSFDGWITRFFDGIPAWGIGQAPDAPGSGFYAGYRSDSRFVFSFGGSDLVTEQAFPGDNAFGHWAGTYNAATGERILYLDGVQIARDIAPADFVSGGALQSGAVDGPLGGQSVGEIDEMRVWARVLDPSELENLGLASLVGDEADLVAYWHFDDVQNIDGAQAFANDFPDYGPNGHPLLGNEFASWGASNNPRRLFFLSTVETGTGSGFMSIDVADLDTVRDAAGNPLGGPGVGNGDFVDGVEIEIDRATPVAQSLVVEDGRSVVVAFDETLSNPSLLVSRFALSGTGKGTLATNPASATQFAPGQVRLTWSAGSMTAGGDLTITIGLVRDIVGNQMAQNGTDNVVTLVGGGVAFDGYGGMLVR